MSWFGSDSGDDGSDSGSSDTLNKLLDIGASVATPFAQRWAYGGAQPSGQAQIDGRIAYNRMNGSGANNAYLSATQSPRGPFDFLLGRQDSAAGTSYSFLPLVMLAGLGLVVWLVLRR